MLSLTGTAKAQMFERDEFEYVGSIEVSAYYPSEDARYPNNYKSIPLDELVGYIVACPTGSDLIGKWVMLRVDDVIMVRKVWDTGCKKGRLDLLVLDSEEMNKWGLKQCDVWVIG